MASNIPLRNIWLLFLYAADLVRFKDSVSVEKEAARDLPELLARLLVRVVQLRLRRNLSRGYQAQNAVLSRVRGRIDVLATVSGQLLEQGRVACRFQEHTMDTPRNRLVRAALEYKWSNECVPYCTSSPASRPCCTLLATAAASGNAANNANSAASRHVSLARSSAAVPR